MLHILQTIANSLELEGMEDTATTPSETSPGEPRLALGQSGLHVALSNPKDASSYLQIPSNMLPKSDSLSTPHREGEHDTGAHQESTSRLQVLCGTDGILRQPRFASLEWKTLESRVRISDILRVHDYGYWKHLTNTCKRAASPAHRSLKSRQREHEDVLAQSLEELSLGTKAAVEVADTTAPMVFPSGESVPGANERASACGGVAGSIHGPTGSLDTDTPLSAGSLQAAIAAAGAVIAAVDDVVAGSHRGCRGAVVAPNFHTKPEMCSAGFCLLNNVAIAAAYAKSHYGPRLGGRGFLDSEASGALSPSENFPIINRVCIVDFDIHHGNGTEDIVRNLTPRKIRLPLPQSWAPQEVESYKPWFDEQDAENVLFTSIHLFDGRFYPCSGGSNREANDDSDAHDNIVNVLLTPLIGDNPQLRARLSETQRRDLRAKASTEFRNKIQAQVLPRLNAFKPDLVLVSAGFDGHMDDFYHFLHEDDYAWFTHHLQNVANRYAGGRLVSVLEGGYNTVPRRLPKQRKNVPRGGVGLAAAGTIATATATATASATTSASEEDERLRFGGLARACAAHVEALMQHQQPQDVITPWSLT